MKETPNTENIRRRYNRAAVCYDLMDAMMEWRLFRRERERLLSNTEGRVLEVGVGTGKNLPWYPKEIELTGIDFSPGMLARAQHRAERLGLKARLMEMDAQKMQFDDNSFDTVVSTCVFCSVPDPVAGLKEIRRVCKPGGQILMLEHMRSERPLVGGLMDIFNWVPLHLYGANINRRTLENLKIAGFNDISAENVWSDIFKRIAIVNNKR